jgi:hypothetical protein
MDLSTEPTSPLRSSDSPISFRERRNFIKNEIPEEVRLFRRTLNKITGDERTFEGYMESILKISILKNEEEDDKKDEEAMKPVVDSFLSMIYEDKESNNNIEIYGKLFTSLVNDWSGRQGKILMTTMIGEINTFIQNYKKMEIRPDEIAENPYRRKCFCILKFLHYLYQQKDILPGKVIMIVMENFFSSHELHLEVFIRILKQNFEKLNTEKIFISKLKDKYKKFLIDNKNSDFTSRNYNYMIEDVLKVF